MKRWYHIFSKLYTKIPFIQTIGRFFISTKEERILQYSCWLNEKKLKKFVKKEDAFPQKKFNVELAICAIMKNEGSYLCEWIDYHSLLGVKKFYLYDHDSIDNTYEVLRPYIQKGIVEYNFVSTPGSKIHHPQREVYTEAVVKHREEAKWIAFIDIDEFIVPENTDKSIIETLRCIEEYCRKSNYKVGGIGVNWLCYGSSGHFECPDGLVIENYKCRASDDYDSNSNIKTIANPRYVVRCGIHRPYFNKNCRLFNEEGNLIEKSKSKISHKCIRINHYSSKSKMEALERAKKGFGGASSVHNPHDQNVFYDNIMDYYIQELETMRKG